VLDTHSPLVCYPSLRYTDFVIVQLLANFRHQTFRTKPSIVQVGHYGRPTVTPRRWQLASPPVLGKTTKMPLRFRQPAITKKNSHGLSPKASASRPPPLPKGWVYAVEEVGVEVKAEVIDPDQYQITNAPLTRSQLNHAKALADPDRRLRRASSITEGRRCYASLSVVRLGRG
jgi:hypothetical protein